MAPQVGLEPTTLRLTAGCSAIELLRSVACECCVFIISFTWAAENSGRLGCGSYGLSSGGRAGQTTSRLCLLVPGEEICYARPPGSRDLFHGPFGTQSSFQSVVLSS